jgi:Zn-finger domain-containing protein
VAARVSPTETICAEIHELFASGGELLSVIEQVARLWVRLTFQRVIEEIVCEELGRGRRLRAEFDTWKRRDLSGVRLDDLYLDGSFCKMHPKTRAEPVLVAWGSRSTAGRCSWVWPRGRPSRPMPGGVMPHR